MSANDTAGNNFQTSSLSIADLKRAVAQVSARSILRLPPGVTQTVKTQFAVR